METATLLSEVFAFLIILFVLYRYVVPPIAGMTRKRKDTIQQQVQDSEEAARTLARAQERFESALAQARGEAARIRDDARADAQRIRQELRAQADREVERIRQRGEEQLVAQRELTVRQLRAEIGGLSMALAERIIVESLSDDERRRSTVDRFLADLDQLADRDSVERDSDAGVDVRSAGAPRGGGF